jgi:hypothetical protein
VRVLFPLILLACGVWLEWQRPATGWRRRIVAAFVSYVCLLGIVGLLVAAGPLEGKSGGRIGDGIADILPGLITEPGAFIVLTIIGIAALALALDRPLRALFAGPLSGAKDLGAALLGDRPPASASRDAGPGGADVATARQGGVNGRRRGAVSSASSPGQAGIWGGGSDGRPVVPSAAPSPMPVSSTFAPAPSALAATAVVAGDRPGPARDPTTSPTR